LRAIAGFTFALYGVKPLFGVFGGADMREVPLPCYLWAGDGSGLRQQDLGRL